MKPYSTVISEGGTLGGVRLIGHKKNNLIKNKRRKKETKNKKKEQKQIEPIDKIMQPPNSQKTGKPANKEATEKGEKRNSKWKMMIV